MNERAHSHQLGVNDHGRFWGIRYGDQHEVPDKPWRWLRFWQSDEAYARTCQRSLLGHIQKIVGKHDDESQKAGRVADLMAFALPALRADEWGSAQLAGISSVPKREKEELAKQ